MSEHTSIQDPDFLGVGVLITPVRLPSLLVSGIREALFWRFGSIRIHARCLIWSLLYIKSIQMQSLYA
jgi:hypothetical protein